MNESSEMDLMQSFNHASEGCGQKPLCHLIARSSQSFEEISTKKSFHDDHWEGFFIDTARDISLERVMKDSLQLNNVGDPKEGLHELDLPLDLFSNRLLGSVTKELHRKEFPI